MGLRQFLTFFFVFFVLGIGAFFSREIGQFVKVNFGTHRDPNHVSKLIESLRDAPLLEVQNLETKTKGNCHHYNCFNVYQCGDGNHKKALVHIPKPYRVVSKDSRQISPPLTSDFVDILEAIVESEFYTDDPSEACVLFPAFNLMNEEQLDPPMASKAIASLPHWNEGENNLLLSFVTGGSDSLRMAHGAAMVAAAGLSTFSYRNQFDIALPFYTTMQEKSLKRSESRKSKYLTVVQGTDLEPKLLEKVQHNTNVGMFYPTRLDPSNEEFREDKNGKRIATSVVLSQSRFCFIGREKHGRLTTPMLMAALHAGCVPIIAIDSLVLPFSETVDWKRFSIRFYEHDAHKISDFLSQMSEERYRQMHMQLNFVYDKYFKDLRTITQTTLTILSERIFPQHSKTYMDWNLHIGEKVSSPILSKSKPPAEDGFTAVILTHDRVESLYQVIKSVSQTPSLAKIVVVWNNQDKGPPPLSEFPVISKNITIVRTSANLLTNRFHPYPDIQTEAVLSLDDDINMLTSDEFEFGYQTWREFPDRIVGFPSRTHVWNNVTGQWKYESEWLNQVSMVLTGASFYHKYWHYLFTANPSPVGQEIKAWLDQRMNCEDIAMNFLVANATGKAPIKIGPRKKFKCSTPQCNNVDMLSNYQTHLTERSECVNFLTEMYGFMPLKNAEFRADPVLFKDKFPDKLKHFANIGSL